MLQKLLVGCIAQGNTPEVVLVHKLVEEIGTEHNGLWYLHRGILKMVQLRMALDNIVEESQTTTFTTQRTITNTGKVGKAVELQTVEHSHHTNILHATVLNDGIEDNLSVGIQVLQFVPRHRLEELRHREDGTCTEPTAHIVARHMILERIGRNIEDVIL